MKSTHKFNRLFLMIAALSGLFSVALGAWGSHGLKSVLSEHYLQTFLTGVEYQANHSLALLFVSLLPASSKTVLAAGWSFIGGIILFSGSLYLLALSDIRSLGLITPFGGLLFMCGWLCLFLYALKNLHAENS
jgi:uncharacterized membrane protein YgdD (TMEM256/DUF423 family)